MSTWVDQDFKDFRKAEKKLRKQLDNELSRCGGINSGHMLEVDYFALIDVLDFIENANDDLKRLNKVGNILSPQLNCQHN